MSSLKLAVQTAPKGNWELTGPSFSKGSVLEKATSRFLYSLTFLEHVFSAI
jgi:hypothetical protein